MSAPLFSIGHSTHKSGQFVKLLQQHQIQVLIDIRRFPGSRSFPQFQRDNLEMALPEVGIEYRWLEALGGRRSKIKVPIPDQNLGLRNESFRNYADYMSTEAFRRGVNELLRFANDRPTVFMCSESVFWRCHRRLVSDFLMAQGLVVQHIMPNGDLRPHTFTPEAIVHQGGLTYPRAEDRQPQLPF